MKLRDKQTGMLLEVPDTFAQANPGLYESPEATKPTVQQPQSLQSQAGNFLFDMLKSATSPFVKTEQNILTAGQEATKAIGIDHTSKVSTDIIDRLNKVSEQLRKEKDPIKKKALLDESRKLSSGLSGLTQATQKISEASLPSPLVRSKEDIAKITTLPGAAEEIGRNTAGIMSYAIDPTGGGLKSQILKSALQGGLMTASQEGTGVADILGGAGISGTLGGVLGVGGRLLGRGKQAVVKEGEEALSSSLQKISQNARKQNIGEKITSLGQGAREAVLNPSTSGGTRHITDRATKNALQEALGIQGSSTAQLTQLGEQGKYVGDLLKSKLAGIKTQVTKKSLNNLFEEELPRQITVSEKKAVRDAISQVKGDFAELMAKGKGSAAGLDIYNLKSLYGDDLAKAFAKLQPKAGGTPGQLTAIEEVKMAAFNALKKAIDSVDPNATKSVNLIKDIGTKNPSIKALNSLQHATIEMANDLIETEGAGKGAQGLTERLFHSRGIQSLTDLLGRGGMGVGRALDRTIKNPAGQAVSGAVGLGERFPAPLMQILSGAISPKGQEQITTTPEETISTQFGTQPQDNEKLKELLQMASIYDLAKNKGKQATEIKTVMDILGAGSGAKKTDAERAASDTGVAIETAIAMLPSIKSKVGPFGLGTRTAGVLANVNMADKSMLDFATNIANIRANISKARAGTALTPTEERMLDKYTPNEGDSYQNLETKLRWLQKNFGPKIIK